MYLYYYSKLYHNIFETKQLYSWICMKISKSDTTKIHDKVHTKERYFITYFLLVKIKRNVLYKFLKINI